MNGKQLSPAKTAYLLFKEGTSVFMQDLKFLISFTLLNSMFSLLPHRSAGLDSSWLHTWPNQGVDGAGPSTAIRSVGLGRVQMMMRHLASVGETYAQTALEDTAWSLWPMNPSQDATTGLPTPPPPPPGVGRYPRGTGGLHVRTVSRPANDNIANILAMAETVREVLPHVPDDLIFEVSFIIMQHNIVFRDLQG